MTDLSLTPFQLINMLLVVMLLFIGFKLLEQKWSYKISKPHCWEDAVKNGSISRNLRKIERTYRDKVRFYTFWLQMERIKTSNIPGAFAELGVYRGETAKIIHELSPERDLHLFDTFHGFTEADLSVEKNKEGKYTTSTFSDTHLDRVKKYIGGNKHVLFHPGYFPDSVASVNETTYAFVHLDADLYQPTISALQYFYPKLSHGGVIIIHDYNHSWDGVREAVDEFSQTIPEKFVEIADWQGSVMIAKNSGLPTFD